MLHTPSHHILILITVGVSYLINELLFEFDLTIENLRRSSRPNLVNPWFVLASFNREYLWK